MNFVVHVMIGVKSISAVYTQNFGGNTRPKNDPHLDPVLQDESVDLLLYQDVLD